MHLREAKINLSFFVLLETCPEGLGRSIGVGHDRQQMLPICCQLKAPEITAAGALYENFLFERSAS
jgi:hypothetical protein